MTTKTMPWFIPAILSHLFFAISSAADRYLLAGLLPAPAAYAFSVGITCAFTFVLIPFGFEVPDPFTGILALSIGALNIVALTMLFRAIQKSGASRIIPTVGAMLPVLTLGFSTILAPEESDVGPTTFAAIAFLVFGTLLLTTEIGRDGRLFSRVDLKNALGYAFLASVGLVLTKFLYTQEPFINAVVWMAFGGFLTALALLTLPSVRRTLFQTRSLRTRSFLIPFLVGATTGGLASLLLQYAIFLTDYAHLALINALQGIRYVFLLLIVIVLAKKNARLLAEEISRKSLPFRIGGTIAITIGIFLIIPLS